MDAKLSFIALGIFAVLTVADIWIARTLVQYRVDISSGQSPWAGRSWLGQVNVWKTDNYTAEGRRRLPYYLALNVTRGLTILAWLYFSTRAFL
jgi:hypothetical protein